MRLPEGPRGSAQPGLPPASRRAGPSASNLQARNSGLDPDAGRVRSPRAALGRGAKKGQLFLRRLDVLPGSALPSASLEKRGEHRGGGGGEFPEQSWPHFSFSQVSIKHLLDAWALGLVLLPGAGEKREVFWAPRVSAGSSARTSRSAGPGHLEEGKPGSSPLPPLSSFPLPFLPPGCISSAPPLLINSSHTSPLSLALH